MKKKDNICPFSIGDVFLQTYVISKRIKLRIPDTTQMKDLSKGFTGITNFNPFFLCYGSKERFKNPPFFLPPRLGLTWSLEIKRLLWVQMRDARCYDNDESTSIINYQTLSFEMKRLLRVEMRDVCCYDNDESTRIINY